MRRKVRTILAGGMVMASTCLTRTAARGGSLPSSSTEEEITVGQAKLGKTVQKADLFEGSNAEARIAACIAALPPAGGTCDARRFAGTEDWGNTLTISKPVVLLLGATTFVYKGTGDMIDIPADAKGPVVIRGQGGLATVGHSGQGTRLINNSATGHAINSQMPFDSGALVVEHLSITSEVPQENRVSGNAINVDFGDAFTSVQVHLDDADAVNHYFGVRIVQPISSTLRRIRASALKADAFRIEGGTSTSLINTYAIGAARDGYAITNAYFPGKPARVAFGPAYMSLEGTASDSAKRDGYSFFGAGAVSLTGCGTEAAKRHGFRLVDTVGITLISTAVLAAPGTVGNGYQIEGSARITFISPGANGINLAGSFGIDAVTSSSRNPSQILVIGPGLHSWSAAFNDPQHVITLLSDPVAGGAGLASFMGPVVIGKKTLGAGSLYVTRNEQGDDAAPIVSDQANAAGLPFAVFSTGDNATTLGRVEVGVNPSRIVYRGGSGAARFPVEVTPGIYGDGGGFKHSRISTQLVGGKQRADVNVRWATPFADANYTVTCAVLDTAVPGDGLRIERLRAVSASSVAVELVNDAPNARSGTLHCQATHD